MSCNILLKNKQIILKYLEVYMIYYQFKNIVKCSEISSKAKSSLHFTECGALSKTEKIEAVFRL